MVKWSNGQMVKWMPSNLNKFDSNHLTIIK